ncbi:hydroxycinnamoyl shikimate quinate hydroxycinnamoyltransferase [Fusarium flagelliforme]|uniref:Hydroxycinnamoyl shikimate quinate hydroxycinnamoyltransferase n=1 Tax=Fusarium flagelliforme TaxID=2675880 RepID=A0A395MKC8_9HYPO|nr:hydroxycinnamoyl shikimate quinate hydroxycinnamoyltransferase [Fusarium flagelliforme]
MQRIDIHHPDGNADRDFPLSFLDTYFMPVDLVLVINGTLDKDQLCQSLTKALALYPPVFGRFKRPRQGELLLHLYHSVPLYFGKQDVFHPYSWRKFTNGISTKKVLSGQAPLFQVTVTYLSTAQTVLGISFFHVLGDVLSLYSLLRTWSGMYSEDKTCIPPPLTKRIGFKAFPPSVSVKEIPQQLPRRSQRFSPTLGSKITAYAPLVHAIVFKTLEYARFNVTAEHLNILVEKARSQLHPANCSTQDAFKAYLLKALNRFVYTKLTSHPRVTRIVTIVDARRARNVPGEYFGNCITACDTPYLAASTNLSQVANAVRQGINALTADKLEKGDEWIQSIQAVNGLMDLTPAFEADTLYVDDWTKVSMEEVDFGLQQDMFCQPLEVEALPVRNWCMIYKAKDLGYQIQVSVPKGKAGDLVKGIKMDLQEEFDEYFW